MKAVLKMFAPNPREPRVLAEVTLENGVAVISKAVPPFKRTLTNGIVGRGGRKRFLEDGEDFIQELPFVYNGSYVRAELVE